MHKQEERYISTQAQTDRIEKSCSDTLSQEMDILYSLLCAIKLAIKHGQIL